MKDGKRKYTFEDWQQGKIPKPGISSNEINKLVGKDRSWVSIWKATDGDWPQFWRMAGWIDKETQLQIEAEKNRAYYIGVENSAESKFRKFKKSFATVSESNKKEFLNLEIQKTEVCFKADAESTNLKQLVLIRQINPKVITPQVYNNFLSTDKWLKQDPEHKGEPVPQIRQDTDSGFKFVDFVDDLFYAHVNHRYLEKLRSYQSTLFPKDKPAYMRVEEIKKAKKITYPKAIEIFNGEVGYRHFKNYQSFKSSRHKHKRGY